MVSDILCCPHVLAIHRSYIDLFGLLGLVRMLGPGVNAQVTELHAPERPARNHALDGLLDHALRKASLKDRLRGAFLDAADKAGVIVIDLVVALAAGEPRMRRAADGDGAPRVD